MPKTDKQAVPTLSAEDRALLRRKCQTDLYWLCKEVLGYVDMVPNVHGPICNTYVKKNPDLGIFEQSETKTRMILAPRGVFKTCIDIGDVVQWILCFPDIRILILTGKQDLAWRMIREVKGHFQTNDKLRELFPEFCPTRNTKWGTDDEFTSPARKAVRREPTVSSSTISSINAGSHFEVVKPDDCVNEINSNTVDQCAKVNEAFDGLKYLLEPGGFIEINGTRYKPWDLYGSLLKREEASRKEWEEDEDREGAYVSDLMYTILSAWTYKPGRVISRDSNGVRIVKKDDVDLLFPERLKFRGLYKQYRDNPTHFACQMLNNPELAEGTERPCTSSLIDTHTIPYTQLPHPSACQDFIMWDLAGVNQNSDEVDFSVGAVGRLDPTGRLYIIDMVRGKWNATQLATEIVKLAREYPKAAFTRIEDAQNARYLEPTIQSIAAQCGFSLKVEWVKVSRFGGAKRYRIDALAQFFRGDKLWLAAHLPYLEELKSELLDKRPLHDDCSDAVALLVKELGLSSGVSDVSSLPVISKKEIAERLFAAAIYGDDDDQYVVEVEVPDSPAPQVYSKNILGYGWGSPR